jgi:hypothetical protein
MTNIINFDRDMFWTDFSNPVAFASGRFNFGEMRVGTSQTVHDTHAFVQSEMSELDDDDGKVHSVGCNIRGAIQRDNTVYRVKGMSMQNALFCYGYSDGENVLDVRTIAAGQRVDEAVVVRMLVAESKHVGKPLCFFACQYGYEEPAVVALSVQRLSGPPDQYMRSVS